MTYENQSQENKNETISSLSQLTTEISEEFNLKNSLIREIDRKFFEQHCLRSPGYPLKLVVNFQRTLILQKLTNQDSIQDPLQ